MLTTHPKQYSANPLVVQWGATDPSARGPVVATLLQPEHRNAIGTHNGPYAVYRAVAVAKHEAEEKPDAAFTEPAVQIGPYPSWHSEMGIVAMDPWGHLTGTPSGPGSEARAKGVEMQPTVAVSEAEVALLGSGIRRPTSSTALAASGRGREPSVT